MCLIIGTKDKDTILDKVTNHELLAAARGNDDGIGVMYPHLAEGAKAPTLVVAKFTPERYNPEACVEFFMKHLSLANVGPFASHMRFTTDGTNCDQNTHPYQITSIKEGHGKDLYMMHNGVMGFCRPSGRKYNPEDKDSDVMSDTAIFVEDFLKPILTEKPKLIFNPGFQAMLAQTVGAHNKLLFMDETGQIVVINKSSGGVRTDEDGREVWLSSPSYLQSSFSRGGTQTGTNTFPRTTQTQASTQQEKGTSQTRTTQVVGGGSTDTTGASKPVSNIITLPNQELARSDIKDILKGLKEQDKEKLKMGNGQYSTEPDTNQPEFRREMIELRDFLKDFDYEQLCGYVEDAPEEVAALLYLHLHGYTYGDADKKFLQDNPVEVTQIKAA